MSTTLTIGIDVGGTRTKAGLVNLSTGEVLHQTIYLTEKKNAEAFLNGLADTVQECNTLATQKGAAVAGIGIGVPGFTSKGNVLTTYGAVPFMENYPLVRQVEEKFSLPCIIDNDARAIALGEAFFGKGKGFERVLVLTLGTGLGFGFVVNGRFPDAAPFAHMGGNITITFDGGDCYCGKKGCLEALVSAGGMVNLAKQKGLNAQSPPEVFAAAERGEPAAAEVVNQIVHFLHIGIHNYVNLFAPDVVVLGGGIAGGLAPYLNAIKGRLYMGPFPGYDFTLALSELQEEAGILGSASLLTCLPQNSFNKHESKR